MDMAEMFGSGRSAALRNHEAQRTTASRTIGPSGPSGDTSLKRRRPMASCAAASPASAAAWFSASDLATHTHAAQISRSMFSGGPSEPAS